MQEKNTPLQLSDLQTGGRYNWIGQNERLVYLGRKFSGNGYWNQFSLVEKVDQVWCEVLDRDICRLERTFDAAINPAPLPTPASWVGLSPERIAFYQSTHCIFPGTLAKIEREIQTLNAADCLEPSSPDTLASQTHTSVEPEQGLLAVGWQRADGSLHKGCPPLGEPAGWQVIYAKASEPVGEAVMPTSKEGEPVYDLSAVIGLTHRKARTIMERDGHKITGFVLTLENGEKCIVDMSAVRWFRQGEDFLRMMHPPIHPQ